MTARVKCLVWDLDETLWRGTLAEGDRVEPLPAARELVHTLDARGILQSVASRNDPEPALAALEELGLAEYMLVPEIGWGPKSVAVRRIAETLSFAPATVAFIDDRPAERAEVAYHLPQVRCYPAERLGELAGLPEFTPDVITADSARRRSLYRAGFRRDAERESHEGTDEEFLRTLRMTMSIGRARPADLARAAELTVRTSQMNATGVHYSEPDLVALLDDASAEVLVVDMADRFGSHGAVGIVLLGLAPDRWHLRLLATSCRVVPYGAGSVVLDWLIDAAARAGVGLVADFRRTERNRMMEIAYRFAGFSDSGPADEARSGPADEGVQRLARVPERRPAPASIAVDAIEPGVPHTGARRWTGDR